MKRETELEELKTAVKEGVEEGTRSVNFKISVTY
jgi:hypothetical protein